MKIDLRDIIKNENKMKELSNNHRGIFEKKLKKEFQNDTGNRIRILKIAASVLFLLTLGISGYEFYNNIEDTDQDKTKKFNSMSDISPDLKKVEDYYLTHINYQLSKIKITDENRDLLEVYLSQLSVLQKEYSDLSMRLNTKEVNEETIDAMIENLQLRLQLLRQLKKKLEIIKNFKTKENESKQI